MKWRYPLGLALLVGMTGCTQFPANTPVGQGEQALTATESPHYQVQVSPYLSRYWLRYRLFSWRQEGQVLSAINAQRASAGLPALTRETLLNTAARTHSSDMATHDNMSHTGSDSSTPDSRMKAAGATFNSWGENIGYQSPIDSTAASKMMTWWMNSPGHKANILNAKYSRIGIGVSRSSTGKVFFTTVFAN